jgi:predicted GNAT family acetyltransferase
MDSAMPTPHPLDRPIWHALTGRQAEYALGDERAWRFDPDYGAFAAAADRSAESLAALAGLIPAGRSVILMEARPAAVPPGAVIAQQALCHQMVADRLTPGEAEFEIVPLTEADAPDMLALATLTKPGPFFVRTHRLGGFVGVKQAGRLVAMAGERMKPEGFTEVSGVCTHPDFRRLGLAGGLMRHVASRILARGETPFLHSYASNTGAIALYETLGFRLRSEMTMMELVRR